VWVRKLYHLWLVEHLRTIFRYHHIAALREHSSAFDGNLLLLPACSAASIMQRAVSTLEINSGREACG
jgi:hypothetical protein